MKKAIIVVIILTLIITMGFLFGNAQNENDTKLVSAANWEKLRVENPDYIVIDVRTPEEFSEDGINGAINVDYYSPTFKQDIAALDSSKTYLIYCRSGARSSNAAIILQELGMNSVYDLDGGMIAYSEL